MVDVLRDACNKLVDVIADSNGGLVADARMKVSSPNGIPQSTMPKPTCGTPVTGSVQVAEGCLIPFGI
jgi:hypothetical protein